VAHDIKSYARKGSCYHVHVIVHHNESAELASNPVKMTKDCGDYVPLWSMQRGLLAVETPRDPVPRSVQPPVGQIATVNSQAHDRKIADRT
jgi:hypothetical protein